MFDLNNLYLNVDFLFFEPLSQFEVTNYSIDFWSTWSYYHDYFLELYSFFDFDLDIFFDNFTFFPYSVSDIPFEPNYDEILDVENYFYNSGGELLLEFIKNHANPLWYDESSPEYHEDYSEPHYDAVNGVYFYEIIDYLDDFMAWYFTCYKKTMLDYVGNTNEPFFDDHLSHVRTPHMDTSVLIEELHQLAGYDPDYVELLYDIWEHFILGGPTATEESPDNMFFSFFGPYSLVEKECEEDLAFFGLFASDLSSSIWPKSWGVHFLNNTNLSYFYIVFILLLFLFINNKSNIFVLTTSWHFIILEIYNFVLNIINSQVGKAAQRFFPYVFSIFIIILLSNILGMFLFAFTLTSHIMVTFTLGVSSFVGLTILGFYIQKLSFFNLFLPKGIPGVLVPLLVVVELISYLSRALSLSIRLFANLMSGHTLLHILAFFISKICKFNYFLGFLGFVLIIAIILLELCIALLQAYVFTILVCIYLNDVFNSSSH